MSQTSDKWIAGFLAVVLLLAPLQNALAISSMAMSIPGMAAEVSEHVSAHLSDHAVSSQADISTDRCHCCPPGSNTCHVPGRSCASGHCTVCVAAVPSLAAEQIASRSLGAVFPDEHVVPLYRPEVVFRPPRS